MSADGGFDQRNHMQSPGGRDARRVRAAEGRTVGRMGKAGRTQGSGVRKK